MLNQILPTIHGPCHAKTCLWAYADSEVQDLPAHPRSLIRAFIVRYRNHWILKNVHVWMQSKGPDDTLSMCGMIWICAFCACSKALFHLTWFNYYIFKRSLLFSFIWYVFLSKVPSFQNLFIFSTASVKRGVEAVKRLHVLYFSVVKLFKL